MVRYRCTSERSHVWDVDKQADRALAHLKVVPCPLCQAPMRRLAAKYNNECVIVDGHRFQSLREAERYKQLIAMQAAGLIRGLTLQPVYPLIVNNVKIGKYIGDFQYEDCEKGVRITEDVKAEITATPVYRLKKKLIKALYNVDIVEVA